MNNANKTRASPRILSPVLALVLWSSMMAVGLAPNAAASDALAGCTIDSGTSCSFLCVPGAAVSVAFVGKGALTATCPGSSTSCTTSNGACDATATGVISTLATPVGNCSLSVGATLQAASCTLNTANSLTAAHLLPPVNGVVVCKESCSILCVAQLAPFVYSDGGAASMDCGAGNVASCATIGRGTCFARGTSTAVTTVGTCTAGIGHKYCANVAPF